MYNRQIYVDVKPIDEYECCFTAQLDVKTSWTTETASYRMWEKIKIDEALITDTGVDHLHCENEGCLSTLGLVKDLIGTRVDNKYLWRISRVLGKHNGCQHLFELALEIGRAYSNMLVYMHTNIENPPDFVSQMMLVENKNKCAGIAYEQKSGIKS